MKIAYIETSGFRGFRGPFRLNLSPSFTIIYGRNGVGKSTVCDALEYAITGTIDKYRVEKTAKENLNDYLWFRPEEGLKDCYVRIGLIDETTGEQRTITRSREQQLDEQSMAMVRELIRASSLEYEDAVRQLVKTTIIRDEWIAEQSLDLSEYERFRFVSATLGSVDFGEYLKRIDGAARIAQSARDGLRNDAQLQQQTLSQMQAEFARLKAESDKGNLATALEQLAALLGISPDQVAEAGELVSDKLVRMRAALKAAINLGLLARRQLADEEVLRRDHVVEELASIQKSISESEIAIRALTDKADKLRPIISHAESAGEGPNPLATLAQLGNQIGLLNGHCPLCSSSLSHADFEAALVTLQSRASAADAALAKLRSDMASVVASLRAAAKARRELEERRKVFEQRIEAVKVTSNFLIQQAVTVGIEGSAPIDLPAVDRQIERQSRELAAIETAAATLEASRTSKRLLTLAEEIEKSKAGINKHDSQISRESSALQQLGELRRVVLRTSNEILDARLAKLSPLLEELYRRLRPHTEWHTIRYEVRGDIRRFLNLHVGNNLNPQFIFSSGQRRATGLAFLLAVHLSRGWGFNSLVLDDPVQHIDDYRALNLAEVLAAVRRDGRQIVCAVEDRQLARLLARRLRSEAQAPGQLVGLSTDENLNPRLDIEPVFVPVAHALSGGMTG